MNSAKAKFGILGGGLSGLTTGLLLNQKNADFEVLESHKKCGGLMKTITTRGFSFDCAGSHVIFSKNSNLVQFILNLLGQNKVRNRRQAKVLYKGRLVKYPFENGLSDLSKDENYECLSSFIQNLISKAKGDLKEASNLKEWFYCTFGSGIAEKYLIPYNEKIWKYPAEKTALNWVERIPDPPVEDIIRSSLGIKTEGYTHQLYFYYPKVGGIEAIIKALESKMPHRITKGYEVKRITFEDQKWVVSDGVTEKTFSHLVSTIPVQKLVAAIDAPKEVKAAANALKYKSIIAVMLGINKDKLNGFSWLYIPDRNVLTHRVSFPSNYSPCVAPSEKSSVLAEITCTFGDNLWKMKDEEIAERTIDDLSRLRIVDRADVCFRGLQRTEFGYVINDLDYDSNLNTITNYFDKKSIGLVGRFGEFKYLNMDACVESAMNYVKRLM